MTPLDTTILTMARLIDGKNKSTAKFIVGENIISALRERYPDTDYFSFSGVPIVEGAFAEPSVIELKGGE